MDVSAWPRLSRADPTAALPMEVCNIGGASTLLEGSPPPGAHRARVDEDVSSGVARSWCGGAPPAATDAATDAIART